MHKQKFEEIDQNRYLIFIEWHLQVFFYSLLF